MRRQSHDRHVRFGGTWILYVLGFIIFCMWLFPLGGCTQSREAYYQSVSSVQAAQSAEAQARYAALQTMAGQGSNDVAAVAAVMAIALQQPNFVQPQYIPSEALQWTQALAAPVASTFGLWLNSRTSERITKQNVRVNLERIRADGQNQRALYDVLGSQRSTDPAATGQAFQTIETIVQEAFEHFHLPGGCCPICITCSPEDSPPVTPPNPTAGDDDDGGLCVSPCGPGYEF